MLVKSFLTIEKYINDLSLIRTALNISDEELTRALTGLEELGLIALTSKGYIPTKKKTHLSAQSPLYQGYIMTNKLRSMERVKRLGPDKAYSFAVTFSTSPKVREKLHLKLLNLLKDLEQEVGEAPEEEVYQLNLELFDWS